MKTTITLLTSLILHNINSKTIDESETGALLSFPSVIDGPLYNQTYDVAPAQFGYQRYGGSLEGVLVLPKNKTYHKECPKTNTEPSGPEPLNSNPYINYIRDWFQSPTAIHNYIFVIDRLDCYFVDKILHAQLMGASGVIICDWKVEHLFTMWMPDSWRDSISIPSVLLNNEDCHTLMAHLGVLNWNPLNIENMTYPSEEQINWTIATIEWGLPHPDDRVEYELWTSSNDYLGSRFKHNFNTTAILLDEAKDTQFTPHMYTINGSLWKCRDETLPCQKKCTNSGRYCAVDPEYDIEIGLDGMAVIQENLRSLCVWQYDKQEFPGDDIMWWDYAVLWDENCGVYSNSSKNFHENCSYAQMDKLKSDQTLSNFVRDKIIQTGGYGYTDGENSILNTETRLKYNSSIYTVPMVRVNEFLIHGNIDCEPPVTVATCEVLSAICAGFIQGTQPNVCLVTPAPTMAVCNESEKDCNGTCFGPMLLDRCKQCLLVSSHEWNECIGCNGQIDETYDCQGTCGGHYAVNPCGYCKDMRQSTFSTFGQDCNGGCDMNLREDECGQCITESDLSWNSCIGCDNIVSSGKKFNECGSCVKINDPHFDDYGKDCRGICSSSVADTYYVDDCGICLLPADDSWNECLPDNTEVPRLKRKEEELTTVIVIVCIVAFLIIVAAAVIIGALWKKQTSINARFDSLASTYVTMDENPQHSFPISNKGMETVPDDPESVEDE